MSIRYKYGSCYIPYLSCFRNDIITQALNTHLIPYQVINKRMKLNESWLKTRAFPLSLCLTGGMDKSAGQHCSSPQTQQPPQCLTLCPLNSSLAATIRQIRPDLLLHMSDSASLSIPTEMPKESKAGRVIEDIGEPITAGFLTKSNTDTTNWYGYIFFPYGSKLFLLFPFLKVVV